jgi:acyl carrier protein
MSAAKPDREAIKRVIIESLGLEGMTPADIEDDQQLFGEEGLGLDSIDALELIVVFEKDYGIVIDSEDVDPEAFASVAKLEEFILARPTGSAAGGETIDLAPVQRGVVTT